ncbi:MAG: arsenite S-adenosylmethyltransferase, partial [Cyclobacteriaceae bacterium]
EMYAGCVSGAVQKDEYINTIKEAGFTNIKIQKEKKIGLPDEILASYLSEKELEVYSNGKLGIYSITVYAEKQDKACCGPDCCN